jgi:hypothetical protein
MTLDAEAVYGLLPAVYRTRDAAIAESLPNLLTAAEQAQLNSFRDRLAAGDSLDATEQRDLERLEQKRLRGPLGALVEVLAEQLAGLEENVEQLYDDQFIETCAEWVVPYIADLVGYRPLDPQLQQHLGSARADVAETIGFRRRKGTAAMLESLAVAITGWDAAVVEFFLRLATTQYLNHVRPDHLGTVDLRDVGVLADIGGAFDRASHTVDVRRIATRGGRYNIPNVGVFLWRVGSSRVTDAPATRVDARRYLFSALGSNTRLYVGTARDPSLTAAAGPLDVPRPITRRMLRNDLGRLYGADRSLVITVGGQPLGSNDVEACDLADLDADPERSAWHHTSQTKVAIDPELGRIVFPDDVDDPVVVTYHHGSIGEIGGGEYERTASVQTTAARRVPRDRATIGEALGDLGGAGTLEIAGSGVFPETPALAAAADRILVVRAANTSRPVLRATGDVVVSGGDSGEVVLDGLLLTGGRIVVPAQVNGQPNRIQRLRLVHCTLVPGGSLTRTGLPGPTATSIEVEASDVSVEIERSIVGAIRVTDESTLTLTASIVDGLAPDGIAYSAPGGGDDAGGALRVDASTVIGKVRAAELTASNAIFHAQLAEADSWSAALVVERRQAGYVRYSYVPWSAQLPPRYGCQPPDAAAAGTVAPVFTSLRYGDPAYCQLHAACPRGIRCGADDGGEMGVYHDVFAPQRAAALTARLDEYMRFGLEAGLIFAS